MLPRHKGIPSADTHLATLCTVVTGAREIDRRGQEPVDEPSGSRAYNSQRLAMHALATEADVSTATETALPTKEVVARYSVCRLSGNILRAAELVSRKYRFELVAITMLGEEKNTWQAEIDAAAELADFYRFSVSFAEEIYSR
ncbi:uncharacterized protein Z518_08260 [Rhinocladiella mackenziei CBS 650.93]|uniref:Rhinocladiella mackenziei CBS 650.93 unplaced genomic scaffold supercont1.6, whole genome shotgun sequence n=1 Tax=Rhinocladiella mackenziei CBS 650.93 TaxID=1442369 RepID=A0A0D2I902_9EURO|nr:uncharacterized protein Z518_08260 [Rhinocladiella mackenziei CBS 650.93]KIX02319.1 hypothetical protein Z518_08260 [Rhinocladiella mackenziei CBS 650.93]